MRYVTLSESITLLYLVIFVNEIDTVEEALELLDEENKRIINSKYKKTNKADIEAVRVYTLEGMKPSEIAKLMNIHHKTVYGLLRTIEKGE